MSSTITTTEEDGKEVSFEDYDIHFLKDDTTTSNNPSEDEIIEKIPSPTSPAQRLGDEGSASQGTTIVLVPKVLVTLMLGTITRNIQWMS